MLRYRSITASLSLLVVMTISMMPKSTLATDKSGDDERPLRLYATATVGPIGTINEPSGAQINGRFTHQRQCVWGGELIRASDGGTQLTIDSVGEVRLKRGAIARFASVRADIDGNAKGRILVASVITGEMAVRLEESAGAYVEAYGSTFTASGGSSFRIALKDGEPELKTIKGEVRQQQAVQPRYVIRPVAGQGSDLSVRARSTRQIQFRVTDEHDRPVPDVPVVLLLNGSGGELSTGAVTGSTVTATTNAQGVVTANFSAGATPATSSVTATVAGTSVSATVGVTTTAAAAGIISGTTLAIVAGAVAAGAVTAAVAVKKAQDNNSTPEPVVALPPNITPKP